MWTTDDPFQVGNYKFFPPYKKIEYQNKDDVDYGLSPERQSAEISQRPSLEDWSARELLVLVFN